MNKNTKVKLNLLALLLFVPAGYFTYLFHELGHWTIGEFLGNDMAYTLNGVWPKTGYFLNPGHSIYVNLGGPAFTILQSILVLVIIETHKTVYAYPFVFFPVFTRFFSLILGGFSKQDEAKASAMLNAGTYTVALIVLLVLLAILLMCSHKLKIGLKHNCYFMAISTACLLLIIQTYEMI